MQEHVARVLSALTLITLWTGCASLPRVRNRVELGVPDRFVERLPDLPSYREYGGQVIVMGGKNAASGTAVRTRSHGLVVLTNRHVLDKFADAEEVFVFWPEPRRRVEGESGYTAARASLLFPSLEEAQRNVETRAAMENADTKAEIKSVAQAVELMKAVGEGFILRIVNPDLGLLKVDEAGLPDDEDVVRVARVANEGSSLALVSVPVLYPEPGTLRVDLDRERGTLRAAPSTGGPREHRGREGVLEGNSGTGVLDGLGRVQAVLSGYWKRVPSSDSGPRTDDPRADSKALVERFRTGDLDACKTALGELKNLWAPHLELGASADATLLIRLPEILEWLAERGVELE